MSSAIDEYLEAIYKLQQEEHPVHPSRLAKRLKVAPSSVAEMLKKLAQQELVSRTEDLGTVLTPKGEEMALRLIRKHRLAERFLTDILGIPWDKAHDQACQLEHVFSAEATEGLEKFLENPRTCPHGYPIPQKDGTLVEEATRSLDDLQPGERAVIICVDEEEPKMLQYLATLGLLPSTEIEVEEVGPFHGPFLVRVGRAKYALGREVASKIRVKAMAVAERGRGRIAGRGRRKMRWGWRSPPQDPNGGI
ncbi:MAG: metal-dependent transcriptional regulator [Chloroflexi bacterium]|nr:metal-dependent transcriptional regulator [Chloroflexota bacterium]MCL5074331.1 metal-dependent transcriptional regulator [Chloroflexota bacterium]